MTKPNFTEIVVVADRSGSMSSIRNDVIGGFNAFVEDQLKLEGEAIMTYAQFDHEYNIVFAGTPLKDVPKLTEETYVPRGMTALNDAVGRTIVAVGERLAKMPENERPSQVIFCIITDGYENQSKEYTSEKVKQLIEQQTNQWNWTFVYLSADINAFDHGKALGISASNVANFAGDGRGAEAMSKSFSAMSSDLRSRGVMRCSAQSYYNEQDGRSDSGSKLAEALDKAKKEEESKKLESSSK